MSNKYYHINGISVSGGNIPPRLEFNKFAEDADVLNLYLLALRNVQSADPSVLTSFFQVGGIHGKPYKPWDGVQGQANYKFGGYCTHGTVIFPTWHRPYVALYEQVIWQEASSIANSYEDKALKSKYSEALLRLRQPYYDWAARGSTIHPLLNSYETVSVITAPKGEKTTIRNPLLSYSFDSSLTPSATDFTPPYSEWSQTMRQPLPPDKANARSQYELVDNIMRTRNSQLRQNVFELLAYNLKWETMSNHHQPGNSLELIHDNVHVYLGGAGHMGDPPVAGFDPIFYLHHANVDRLLALWQVLHPDQWVVPGSSQGGTFTIAADKPVDAKTDLTPFHHNDETVWNSDMARDIKVFGYTYPEIRPDANPEDVRRDVMQAVYELYAPLSAYARVSKPDSTEHELEPAKTGNPSSNPGSAEAELPSGTLNVGGHQDWFATISVNPKEFERSGYVFLFMGDTVPSGGYMTAPECIGEVAIFKNTSGQCDNCNVNEAADRNISGQVPLTEALKSRGRRVNDVQDIGEYLKTHLNWRCALVDGTEVPLEQVPSLQVKVFSATTTPPPVGRMPGFPTRFPARAAPQLHHSITHGRLGGYTHTD